VWSTLTTKTTNLERLSDLADRSSGIIDEFWDEKTKLKNRRQDFSLALSKRRVVDRSLQRFKSAASPSRSVDDDILVAWT